MRQKKLIVVVLVSLAFNVGFASQVFLDWSRSRTRAETATDSSDVAEMKCYPKEFHQLCNRLQAELEALRNKQAEQTRRLAQLMTSNTPDPVAISLCLDEISATERLIKGMVMDTVLAQRATLEPAELESFCSHIQTRLCAPWANCRPTGGCPPNKEDHSDQ